MTRLSEKIIKNLNDLLLKNLQATATSEYLENLLENTEVKKILLESGGVDTYERELFFNILSQSLIGKDWPTYSDSEEVANDFLRNLVLAIEKNEGIFFVDE